MNNICPFTKLPCQNPKNIQVTDLKDGKFAECNHVCQFCINVDKNKCNLDEPIKKAEVPEEVLNLLKIISSAFSKATESLIFQPVKSNVSICPKCGMTSLQFAQQGRYGCENCYDCFRPLTEHILQHCQEGALTHVGKIPKSYSDSENILLLKDKIKSLEAKMQKAIEIENYEIAGVLKNKIKELQQQMINET